MKRVAICVIEKIALGLCGIIRVQVLTIERINRAPTFPLEIIGGSHIGCPHPKGGRGSAIMWTKVDRGRMGLAGS